MTPVDTARAQIEMLIAERLQPGELRIDFGLTSHEGIKGCLAGLGLAHAGLHLLMATTMLLSAA